MGIRNKPSRVAWAARRGSIFVFQATMDNKIQPNAKSEAAEAKPMFQEWRFVERRDRFRCDLGNGPEHEDVDKFDGEQGAAPDE
jgi:hypothetical protein